MMYLELKFSIKLKRGGHHICDNIDELDELLFNLRKAFIATGEKPWSAVTLSLNEDGKFSLKYGYEDISNFELAGERRERWLEQYLGSNAKIIYEE